MKTIVLGRHAKSDWSLGLPDFDRPLNGRGNKDAPKMGKLLSEYGVSVDLILSSPAKRARTTAEIIAEKIAYPRPIRLDQQIYDDGHGTLFGIFQVLQEKVNSVMMFGHNPTMENLASYMLQMRAGVVMPTCSLICMEASVYDWERLDPSNISLKWFLIPRLVK